MKKCNGCGTEFDDSVELFPRLVISKEVQVARRLAEREEEEDMLCLGCWLEAVDHLDKKQLAMLLLGMLKKIDGLQEELAKRWSFPGGSDIVEKEPQTYPWGTHPNSGPIWVSDSVNPPSEPWVGDRPRGGYHRPGTTICKVVSYQDPNKAGSKVSAYLSGTWAQKVQ